MEFHTKTYTNQASRIGVKYSYAFQAVKAYEDLIRKHPGERFSIKLEPLKQKLNLTLQSDHKGTKIVYKDLLFRPEQLRKLENIITPDMFLEFVHIYSEANRLLIAKPFKKEEFIRISKCEIIGIEDYN